MSTNVQGDRVVWGAEVTHRGAMIKRKLADRSARRRNRRSRLRYRKPSYRTKAQINNAKRTYERKREQGWLAPSLRHRVDTTMTWVNRLIRFAPVGELTQELVRFDLQRMENPEVDGVQYQQGELVGFEVKEYSTRWALHGALVDTGLPVTVGTGGQTKFNRKQLEWSKAHWLDAAAVGDIAKCGDVQGRISPRTSGSFEIRPPGGKPFSRPMRFFTPIHRNDGFEYGT